MKLAGKIVVVFLVGAVVLLTIDGVFAARRERALLEEDALADARLLGRAMQTVVADMWRLHGEEEALGLIADVDRLRPLFSIRWLWIDSLETGSYEGRLTAREAELLRRGQEVVVRPEGDPPASLVTYYPVELAGERTGALELLESLEPLEGAARSAVIRIGLLTLALSALAVILAVPLGMRLVGRPLESLVAKTRRIGHDDFSGPLRLRRRDELAELADALNTMSDRLAESRDRLLQETEARIAALEQLRHEDRLRTVGRLASGVAHELGTPLNVVQGRAGLIATRRLREEEIVQAAEIIKAQAQAMTGIVRQLLDFARRQAPEKAEIRPQVIAREVVELLRPMARKKDATVRVAEGEAADVVWADPGQIRQVLTNLTVNGLQALTHGGTVGIGFERVEAEPPKGVEAKPGKYLCMAVEDEGKGITEEDLPHLFEPFFTTKEIGEGTGLGLSIVHGIVREHGGWIEVDTAQGGGSRFSVFLPLEEGE
jgi:signal transduction histidine kinase